VPHFPGDRETVVLDVAGGTGDIAFRVLESIRRSFVRPTIPPRIIVSDINPSMLEVGKERARERGYLSGPKAQDVTLDWRVGDAEDLAWMPSSSVDLYTIAFGIRNVTRVEAALREAHRVLRPGGRFMCLEFSTVTVPLLAAAYDTYSFAVIPAMGEAVAGDRASYQYLVESIRKFPAQDAFAAMIADAGFQAVRYENFSLGIVALHSGVKLG
jgi:2-methoxy-6-polyprenyl-1,4-benzoquinol methylase